jgi:hypothetical protein
MKKIILITCATVIFILCAFNPLRALVDRFSINTFDMAGPSLALFEPLNGLEDVISALRTGRADEVAKYIEDDVEITLTDKSDTYSKAQAIVILRDFFANNRVVSFEVKHKGSNSNNQFCIGTLQTRSGSFRTTIFMKTKNGRQSVKAIQFQPAGGDIGHWSLVKEIGIFGIGKTGTNFGTLELWNFKAPPAPVKPARTGCRRERRGAI